MTLERPYPQVYGRFTANGEEFLIEDLTVEHSEEALDLIIKYVIPEENFCKALQIHMKPNAMRLTIESYRGLFEKKLSLGCFKKETRELVGLNILDVKKKSDEKFKPSEDSDLNRLRESSVFTSNLYDVFDQFKIDSYLHAYGLGVKEQYRGRGIAVELLRARRLLMKSIGLNVTLTVFSTISSQKAAVKAGFQEVAAVSYREVQENFPDFDFSLSSGSHCKTFVLVLL